MVRVRRVQSNKSTLHDIVAAAGGAAAVAQSPSGGCARRPVGTYLYLHAVGVGKPVAVPGLARQGGERGTGSCDPRDKHLLGSHIWRV
jgi:hypothetical protein